MPRQIESSANNALGELLRGMMRSCDVRSETVRAVVDRPGLRPDILITERGRSAVVVEAEYEPARSVEDEARSRLGLEVVEGGRKVEAVIALRYPDEVASCADLRAALCNARLSYCAFTDDPSEPERFPESGWLHGSVSDLADLIRLVSVPQKAVDAATDAMQRGIEGAAALLDEMDKVRPGITMSIARLLGMLNVPQTRRMASAIVANTMVFHERIAGMHESIKPLADICGNGAANPQRDIMATWQDILSINYWPIFAVARNIIRQLASGDAAQLLRRLYYTTGEVNAAGVDNAHDLTGRVFQRLISDRKYLATFYTLPASAALLARLAVAKMEGVDWSDAESINSLRVGDFACGTGALLSAVYEQIAARHERAGGDPAALHPVMMEDVLWGLDVMPSAVHITCSTLSGVQPSVGFNTSRIYPLSYGRQKDNSVLIGSLDLLQSSSVLALFNTAESARRVGSTGEEPVRQIVVEIPDEGYDLVIMNPPFTRPTNHEGAHANVVNPAFAAFEASKEDMDEMGRRMRDFGKGTCYDGKAGLASAFAALADKKLKPGGVLAMVLPLSVSAGTSWQKFRQLLADEYADLEVVSIAANGKEMSFSSDTGMAECLVVARKRAAGKPVGQVARFVSLRRRPDRFVHAAEIANGLIDTEDIRGIEEGPYGGTQVMVGMDPVGQITSTNFAVQDTPVWNTVRILNAEVAQVAHALATSHLWLPTYTDPLSLKVTVLSDVGRRGLVDRLILGPPHPAPFTKTLPSPTATYPCMWNHDAKKETRMVCEPDSQLLVRRGMEAKANEIWETIASRAHLNREFTFGSQALAVAFTDKESIGGVVWPNVRFDDVRFDYAFAVWGNSTLGLLAYWWHSNRQQSSKARMTVSSAESLPVLDLRALSDEQLATAEAIFDEFQDKELKPAYLADADANRALLDQRVVCDLLGFDEGVYGAVRALAAKWCAEPSVHGGKARPRGAELVV